MAMAGPLELIAAARQRHPAPELLVVTGGEAFPPDGRALTPHVQAMLDAEAARQRADLEGALALFAPDVEWRGVAHGPMAGSYHGIEGIVRFHQEWDSTWEDHERRLQLVIDLGDRIVTEAVQSGRSHGLFVQRVDNGTWWFRDGKVVDVRFFESLETALRHTEASLP